LLQPLNLKTGCPLALSAWPRRCRRDLPRERFSPLAVERKSDLGAATARFDPNRT
jgi:hypothetical protein